jgi:hypothetical protein
MIEAKGGRRFFTHEENYPQLIEFSKTFDVEMSIVKLNRGKVMDLAELAPAICDPNYQNPQIEFEVLETKITKERRDRPTILKNADAIRDYIIKQLMNGKVVTLGDLREKFSKHKLTTACFCNHLRRSLEMLQKMGFSPIKVGGGKYFVEKRITT